MKFLASHLLVFAGLSLASAGAFAQAQGGYLETSRHHAIATSTVPDNGDQNPYALFIAPISAGKVQAGDVLIDNFNDAANLQGKGTTIVDYNPSTKKMTLFAQMPRDLKGCPGGVGLSTAMTMLKSGWVIVGSTPSTDGTTATKGDGCLIVLDSNGNVADVISGPDINDPWGNMAVVDKGESATLFISMTGFGVGAPDPERTIVNKATVLRLELSIPHGGKPVIKSRAVVADGLSERADKEVFIIGPTGLSMGPDGSTLYVSDALNNRVVAVPDALTRKGSAGQGREVAKDGMLHRPLAMITAPNGDLLVTNGKNGQVVEIDPRNGQQVEAQWIDADKAQTPPGSGDLFGIVLTPDGKGFYYVEDDNNALMISQ